MRKAPFLITVIFLLALSAYSQNPNRVDSTIQWKIDSLENALKKFDEQKIKLGENGPRMSDTVKIKILEELWGQYSLFDYDKAILYAQQEIDLSVKIGYKKGMAEGYNRLGVIQDSKSDYAASLDNYYKALEIQNETDDEVGKSETLENIGIIYSKQGNYPAALSNLISSLKISEELNDEEGAAYCYNGIGVVYKLENNYEEALKNYFSELEIFKKLKNLEGEAAAYINIGEAYIHQGKLGEAMDYLLKGLEVANEFGKKEIIAVVYDDMGTVYLKQNKYDESMDNFQKSLSIREEIQDQYGLSSTYINLGNAYFKKGDKEKAIINVVKGLAIAKNIGELEWMKNAYKSLAEIYDSIGNYKLAYQNSVLYKQINDSLFNTSNEKKLTELQLNYEYSKKDALAQREIEDQKLIRNYVAIGMAIIVILLVISLIQRNRIAGVKRQQALEQERSRISRDLHDDLGSGLTGILMMSDQIQATDNKELIGASVEKIKHSSQNMVEQMGEIIWAMNAHNDMLENLLSYIHTYALDYFENQDIKLEISFPEKIPDNIMSGMTRRNIFLVVKESLNNISKHADAKVVSMKIEFTGSNVGITLTDNGKGFVMDKTRRFGNGLKNMESRMTDVDGTFRIESNRGNGTRTFITFPMS